MATASAAIDRPATASDGRTDAGARRRIGDVILSLEHISLAFGGVKALTDITFDVREHEVRAIIGPNGAGKSSMLNVINGVYRPQQGTITFRGRPRRDMNTYDAASHGIARTFQNIALFRGMSVLDNILMGRHIHMRPSALATLFYWWWAERDEVEQRQRVEEIIDFLQLESVRDEPIEVVPLGLQKRVELARALAAEPRFLILDEP
ncbi:MAG TPA: ATP-binding cassette domain-containing protein, partial [Casimicrobiaceae bacterium]|nr:ATP-binding cassette domain-containing protein [Casimicrobiaceae bacterium]